MSESIIVGLVIGVGVAVITGLITHRFRLREMRAHWAEEERRRKSDLRREAREADLRVVRDSVTAVVEAVAEVAPWMYEKGGRESREKFMAEVATKVESANVVVVSLGDQELGERYKELFDGFLSWCPVLDLDTTMALEGKEQEFDNLKVQTLWASSEVRRRIREILEEI